MPPNEVIYAASPNHGALRQGEILSDLRRLRVSLESIQNPSSTRFTPERFSWVIVATQDCDLDFDFKARQNQAQHHKLLPEILFLQMRPEAELRVSAGGEINAQLLPRVRKNGLPRYHYFEPVPEQQDALGAGILALIVDFKSYFTVPTDEVYKRLELNECRRRCFLMLPFRDDFSTRCFNYQSRIALPE